MVPIMSEPLTREEIEIALQQLPEWELEENSITKSFHFANFRSALGFLVQVGLVAETMDHHPEIYNLYNRVSLSLNTHDAGDRVTHKDLTLAHKIEEILTPHTH